MSVPVLRSKRCRGSRGQATLEMIAYLPYLLVMFLVVVELFAYVMTIEQVDSAARAGARIAGRGGDGYRAATTALPDNVRRDDHTRIRVYTRDGEAHAQVTARVPIIARLSLDWTVTRDVTMPVG